jgi:hypothetical protein
VTAVTNGHRTQRELAADWGVSERTVRRRQKAAAANGQRPATNGQRPDTKPGPVRVRKPVTPAPDLLDRWGRPIVGWAVTAIALVISYSHMRHLAELAGTSWPTLIPLLVDGLMAAAVLCLRRRSYWAAWAALVVAAGGTLALNGLAERTELVALADIRLGMALLVPATAIFGVHLVLKR